jgi:SWI/SNF-related matrix-associated actin-dependent regulator 1 of chromatin subfamily A
MLITSKYDGNCTACGGAIRAGDRVSWVKGVRGVKHASCSEEGKAAKQAMVASRATDADLEIPLPDGCELYPYQRAGVAYMTARWGVLQADEMGLGKTIQVLASVNALRLEHVLVICPKSLAATWVREAMKWLIHTSVSTMSRHMLGERVASGVNLASSLLVVTYEEAKKYFATLAASYWDCVVVDEAHLVKNPKAQRSKTVYALAAKAPRRWLLTGTPVPNKPVELFPLLALADSDEWNLGGAGYWRFARRYCDAQKKPIRCKRDAPRAYQTSDGWFRDVMTVDGASNLEELQERLRSTVMIRRLKADVLADLPPKVRQVIELPANGARAALRAEQKLVTQTLGEPVDWAEAVRQLHASDPVAFAELARVRAETALAKVPAVLEHVRMALEGGVSKLLLWGHHHAVIDALVAGLADYSPAELTGRTSSEDRQAAVDRFQTDPACRVFVGSIQAGGVGLTLTAASLVLFAESSWVPAENTQAEDRAHRIGQRDTVTVQHLALEGSLDAHILQTVLAKQQVADLGLDHEYSGGRDRTGPSHCREPGLAPD